jgi:hypothetical protein
MLFLCLIIQCYINILRDLGGGHPLLTPDSIKEHSYSTFAYSKLILCLTNPCYINFLCDLEGEAPQHHPMEKD